MTSESNYNAFNDEKQLSKKSVNSVSFDGIEDGGGSSKEFDEHPGIVRTKTWQERVQKRTRGAAEDEDDDLIIRSVSSTLTDATHMTQMTDYSAMREEEEQRKRELGIEDDDDVDTENSLSDPQGFYVVCAIIFAGDMARGILFPTLWPLLKKIGGQKSHHGFIVAATSIGRILSSPIFGTASEKYGYRSTLMFSQGLLILGSLLYSFTLHSNSPFYLFCSMLTIGIGSGTLGVTRAFVSDITPKHMRTKYIAYLTSLQYGGFTFTPFIGALYVYIFQDREYG